MAGLFVVFAIGLGFWLAEDSATGRTAIAAATFAGMSAYVALLALTEARAQTKIARDTLQDGALPILETPGMSTYTVGSVWEAEVSNIGVGPAIDVRCWISYGTPSERIPLERHGSISAGGRWKAIFSSTGGKTIPTQWTIHIEWCDVYGRAFGSRTWIERDSVLYAFERLRG